MIDRIMQYFSRDKSAVEKYPGLVVFQRQPSLREREHRGNPS
jgi:hypothetical protein